MLCKIDATVGGATDERARAINFLRALQAICTAPAGSTPSVASVTTPTASPVIGTSGSVDVIREVISNTEAGGWTSSTATNITSNYNNSFGTPYTVDLSRNSGKGTYPFRKLTFRTNPYSLFNGSYTSYPFIAISYGFDTSSNPTTNYMNTALTSFDMPAVGGVVNRFRFDVNFCDSDATAQSYVPFRPAAGEWIIASTERYFIALSGALGSTGNPGNVFYAGLRSTNQWEDQYDDNPPLCSFVYDGGPIYLQGTGSNSSMFARTLQTTGQVNSSPAWYRISNQGNSSQYLNFGNNQFNVAGGGNVDPLTGVMSHINMNMNGQTLPTSNPGYWFANELQTPMLPVYAGLRSKGRNNVHFLPMVTDPSTGIFTPPALPISISRNLQNSHNAGGQLFGLYKSASGPDSYLNTYFTPGQNFVVNNEAFYPYVIGNDTLYRDMFLIRRA
jgi:hypothetical protein